MIYNGGYEKSQNESSIFYYSLWVFFCVNLVIDCCPEFFFLLVIIIHCLVWKSISNNNSNSNNFFFHSSNFNYQSLYWSSQRIDRKKPKWKIKNFNFSRHPLSNLKREFFFRIRMAKLTCGWVSRIQKLLKKKLWKTEISKNSLKWNGENGILFIYYFSTQTQNSKLTENFFSIFLCNCKFLLFVWMEFCFVLFEEFFFCSFLQKFTENHE